MESFYALRSIENTVAFVITLSHFCFAQGEPARGLELSRRCLELAAKTQDAGLLAYARWTAGVLAVSCGKLREAVSNLEPAFAA